MTDLWREGPSYAASSGMTGAVSSSSCCSMSFETKSKGPNCWSFHQSLVDGGLGSAVAKSSYQSNLAPQLT